MKIGILTMSYRSNYGGIFQCIALCNILRKMGHDVEVINFQTTQQASFKRRLKLLLTNFDCTTYFTWLSDKLKDKWDCLNGKLRPLPTVLLERCSLFIKENIPYTEKCDEKSIGLLVKEKGFEMIIIGSDKIWGGLGYSQLVYFGDWEPTFDGKLVSYAACSSLKEVPRYNCKKIKSLLARFARISVRDKHTYELIQPYSEQAIQIVADPTILYDFDKYLSSRYANEQPYIFAYILGNDIKGGHQKALSKIKEKYGEIPVKAVILTNESTGIIDYADEIICDADPQTWMNLLAYSSFVYTDSFHGVIFSLKFNKDFIAYYREESRASRLLDLKRRFSIKQNIVSNVVEIDLKAATIPYEIINKEIFELKESSICFLDEAVNE